jgi:23S rRNA pseudouridine1911/1915/1917 synthase
MRQKPTKKVLSKKVSSPAQLPAAKQKQYVVQQPAQLLEFLLAHVTGEGRNAIKSMLARGQIAVDGRAVTVFNYELRSGQIVTLSKDRVVEPPPLHGLSIMYEDDAIIVINKEHGVLSIATDKDEELTAYRQLNAYVRAFNERNRIFIVHRLDRDTSGVMVFAKSEQVQQTMQNDWRERVKERTYVALVDGHVRKPEGKVESWLKENKAMKMYSSPYPGDGLHAITHYKVMQSNRQFSLLEVNLETGRKNQIRVHMQDIGHPIAGDKRYGSDSRVLGRLGLHAKVLAFEHPTKKEVVRFATDVPSSFLKPLRTN